MPKNRLSKKARTTVACAVDLLSNPKNWISGSYFATKGGVSVGSWRNAERFCALGALMKCHDDHLPNALEDEVDTVCRELYPDFSGIIDLNDRGGRLARTKVLKVLKEVLNRHPLEKGTT